MHLRIYLWLSCVLLAGYVRATEEGIDATGSSPEITSAELQHDQPLTAKEPYVNDDDDGSGVDPDESSGSGWGAGPGPDDEDGRGSGDSRRLPIEIPEDDEDFGPRHEITYFAASSTQSPVYIETPTVPVVPEQPEELPTPPPTTTESPILRTRQFNVDVPNVQKPKSELENSKERSGTGEEAPRSEQTDISISGEEPPVSPEQEQEQAGSNVNSESRPPDSVVFTIMNNKVEDRATSFFAQPGILAAVIGGAVVGLLCAILVVMFIVYRMRKKDEGSYALDEPKRSPAAASYGKGHNNREFYA